MRPRLEQITLRGFKTIRELVGFVPGNLTVLIGPNGAGKSNFISFFRMLAWSLTEPGQLQLFVGKEGGAGTILHRGAGVTQQIEATLRFASNEREYEYKFRLSLGAGDILVYADEGLSYREGTHVGHLVLSHGHRESGLPQAASWPGGQQGQQLLRSLRGVVVHHFHNTSSTARIKNKWDAADGRDLKEDGGNLGAFLAYLQAAHPAHYRRIVATIRLILPFFADFELRPDFGKILLQWREIGSDQILNAGQASDGMLRVFALVALLYQPEANLPDMLIIDEPELGLHPYAIEVLASLLRAASKQVQVIVATQSVSLVDRLEPTDIVVVDRHAGETTLRRLDETALTEWLEDYTLSELWEKNVLGGRPSP